MQFHRKRPSVRIWSRIWTDTRLKTGKKPWCQHRVIYKNYRQCGHFVSWQNRIASAFNKHKLQRVLHIQRACRMVRVFSCGPVAFVQEASPVRPLVLIYNSMGANEIADAVSLIHSIPIMDSLSFHDARVDQSGEHICSWIFMSCMTGKDRRGMRVH